MALTHKMCNESDGEMSDGDTGSNESNGEMSDGDTGSNESDGSSESKYTHILIYTSDGSSESDGGNESDGSSEGNGAIIYIYIEITRIPKYYAMTIVSIAIGNQSLLKVSN